MMSKLLRICLYLFIGVFCAVGFLVFHCVNKSNDEKSSKSSKKTNCSFDNRSNGTCLKKELCPALKLENMGEIEITNSTVERMI